MASIENNLKTEIDTLKRDIDQAMTIIVEDTRFKELHHINVRIGGMLSAIVNVKGAEQYWNELCELDRKASDETSRIIEKQLERRHTK